MNQATHKLDKQGRLLVSKSIRASLGVEPGDEMITYLEEGRFVAEPRSTFEARVLNKYKGGNGHEVEDFLELRQEAARQEVEEFGD